jgi:hypothetical protein
VNSHHGFLPFAPNSLYVCLDIPSAENLEQIPSLMLQYFREVCAEHNVKLKITDYRVDIKRAKQSEEHKGASYYDNVPTDEILRFASVARIAFEVLEQLEDDVLKNDVELSRCSLVGLKKEFGDYKLLHWTLHFVCNPLSIRTRSVVFPSQRQKAIETVKAALGLAN